MCEGKACTYTSRHINKRINVWLEGELKQKLLSYLSAHSNNAINNLGKTQKRNSYMYCYS